VEKRQRPAIGVVAEQKERDGEAGRQETCPFSIETQVKFVSRDRKIFYCWFLGASL
jgi:hypothetical protein